MLFTVNDTFKRFDSIIASIPWKENRKYWKAWNSSPKITNVEEARARLGYDVSHDMVVNSGNQNGIIIYKAIKDFYKEGHDKTVLDISHTDAFDELAQYVGFRYSTFEDYKTEKGVGLDYGDGSVDTDELQQLYWNFVSELFYRTDARDRQAVQNRERGWIFGLREVLERIPGFKNILETRTHRQINRMISRLKDVQITDWMDKNGIQFDVRTNNPDEPTIAKIYKRWFASMGAKFRIVPPEMVISGSSSLIAKFNYCLMCLALEFMRSNKKQKEVEALEAWFAQNPLGGTAGASFGPEDYGDFYTRSEEQVIYPSTPENYYETKKYTYLSDPRRGERIGKYLTWGLKSASSPEVAKELHKIFNAHDLENSPDTGQCVVISCHEYDIVGQSTDREWTSCQNIYTGSYKQWVETGIQAGVLIAYLCNVDDMDFKSHAARGPYGIHHATKEDSKNDTYVKSKKINIQNPLGRVLIKPFIKKGEQQNFDDPNWILIVSKKYGTFYDDLIKKLQEWCDRNWNDRIIAKNGSSEYKAAQGLYYDTEQEMKGVTR